MAILQQLQDRNTKFYLFSGTLRLNYPNGYLRENADEPVIRISILQRLYDRKVVNPYTLEPTITPRFQQESRRVNPYTLEPTI
jgi:hypothetical protein